jgi:transposase
MTRPKQVKERNRYSDEFKRKIAKGYLDGQYSYSVAAEQYGLKDKFVVREIVKWYRRKYDLSQPNEIEAMAKSKKEKTPADSALEARIKELEQALDLEKLKTEALETMIDIAEEQLQIDIRKKSGSQQSKK